MYIVHRGVKDFKEETTPLNKTMQTSCNTCKHMNNFGILLMAATNKFWTGESMTRL